jgi:hypothetical protein
MENNLGNDDQEKKIEDIAEQDWPYLKELETTRFALKNKKDTNRKRQTLQSMKNRTEKEDQAILEQNLEDEKLVEAFLNVKPSANDNNDIVDLVPHQDIVEPTKVIELEKVEITVEEPINTVAHTKVTIQTEEKKEIIAKEEAISSPTITVTQTVIQNKEEIVVNKEDTEKDLELSKLIARGMAKTYISKTDTILNPLRFIISNSKQLGIALIQFIIPAIITWYLTTNVSMISAQLNKEAMHIHVIYTIIFYFACLFLWITGQVLFGGIWNLVKQSMNNLAKVGKS